MADWKSALRNWIRRDEPGAVALKKSNAEYHMKLPNSLHNF
jgi:hypothetical protein